MSYTPECENVSDEKIEQVTKLLTDLSVRLTHRMQGEGWRISHRDECRELRDSIEETLIKLRAWIE